MKKVLFLAATLAVCSFDASGQKRKDTVKTKELKEVIIKAWQRRDISRLPDIQGNIITTGKKNEVINLAGTNANIAIKTGRQVFSKVPGVFVYDMDGSGNQINISTRGLDPHRSWELNSRQNGIIINSDMYGYPASHYSPPMESFERIEIIRGSGSLQYGAQFGGMVNYVTKKPDTSKAISFESMNTIGSFGLISSYNAISGTHRKFSYAAYYYRRHSGGYRANSESDANAQFVKLQYNFSRSINVRAELGRSKYLYKIPGPLNDSMFLANPTISTRSRNYFSPDIYIPSITLDWCISPATTMSVVTSGVFGTRSSVQFDAFANVQDAIDPSTSNYRSRQIDIDKFNSRTVEAKVLHQYFPGAITAKLATGIVYMNNHLHRRQLGIGTTGSDYDLTLTVPEFGRDVHFKSENVAVFAENALYLNDRWTVSAGIRWEKGDSKMRGVIRYYPANELPTTISHDFVLTGVSAQFAIDQENNLYGGYSQSYRPVIFKDIIPASTYEQINKDLKDASGHNIEAGIRGKLFDFLQYDVSVFTVLYKNRMGTLVYQNSGGQSYTYRTNIGDSRTSGIEAFVQYKFPVSSQVYLGVFSATSFMHGKYIRGEVADGGLNKSIVGNKIEAVPECISRNGFEMLYKGFSGTLLYNYTSSSFSDALNTMTPPASGAKGFTPGYSVWDFNITVRTNSPIGIRAGINNIFDKQYFTKRPTFYPGPGIWPSDGRNGYVTVSVRL